VTKPYWLQRKKRTLPRTKRSTIPKKLIFFDTETYINEDENGDIDFPFRLGIARYIELDKECTIVKEDISIFRNTSDFIEFITTHERSKTKIYVFAHNVGFDIRVLNLHTEFNNRGYISEPPIMNSRVFIWDIKTGKSTITFLDTANYGVISVDKLGQDMGYDKLEVNFDTVTDDELIIYCKRDVEIVERFMISYIKFLYDNDLGAFKSTIASQAFNAYRYKFMRIAPTIHIKKEALELERNSYFGGRVECFYIGKLPKDNYYYVDYNSMYPYVMLNKPVPHKLKGYTENVRLNLLRVRVKTSYVIAKVLLKTDEPAYPIKIKGKLIFPIGTFITTLHQPDLEHALKSNHILHCYQCAVYESKPIFAQYVKFFYKLKQHYTNTDNRSWRYITKLFLNALYGKFGQRETKRKKIGEIDSDIVFRVPGSSDVTHQHYQFIMWFGKLFKEYREGETMYSCPAIAASITAYARHRLWRVLKIAGTDNTFYMDTDSYIVNQKGYDNLSHLLSEDELGLLALEGSSEDVTIHGNKDYVFGSSVKHKGLPKTAIKLSDNLWEYTQFQGFITWLNLGAKTGMIATKRTKRRLQNYNKGVVDHQTGKVTPIILSPGRLD